jgi:hypothetical protein
MPEEDVTESPSPQNLYPQLLSLGMVIAERRIALREADGREREVLVRFGLPVQTLPYLYRCPAQIVGLGIDERIFAAAGLDRIEAIHHALDLVGQMLDLKAEGLGLTNRCEETDLTTESWIGKIPSR